MTSYSYLPNKTGSFGVYLLRYCTIVYHTEVKAEAAQGGGGQRKIGVTTGVRMGNRHTHGGEGVEIEIKLDTEEEERETHYLR